MRYKASLSVVLFAALAFVVVPAADGQVATPPPVQNIFQGAPGARPLALGGAFIAVADDATAAEANPAGLTILTRPEVSLHVISQSLKNEDCPECGSDSSVRPSFASYVHPMGRAAFSIYYSSGVETNSTFNVDFGNEFFIQSDDTTLRRVGVAGAFRPLPMLSVGASVGLSRLSKNVRTNGVLTFIDDGTGNSGLVEFDETQNAEDSTLTYNVGVVVNPAGKVSLGAVYKRIGEFDAQQTGSLRACIECTVAELRTLPFQEFPKQDVRIETPSLWGAGVAVRPFPRALLALDYTVQKSRAVVTSNDDEEIRAWRAGGEYVFATRNSSLSIPVRAGCAREKDSDFITSDFFREEATTYSLGAGVVFGPNQIDIAFSRGHTIATDERSRQIIVSGIHRF